MATLTEFITKVIGSLNDAGLVYIVTGSYASIIYSEPRTTQDIDFVVQAPFEKLERFGASMAKLGFYVPAFTQDVDMFNIVDTESQWKADIIIFQDDPFENERFSRKSVVELLPGVNAFVPTVEDMILAKLRWIKGRDSALQLHDVESMIEINEKSLDREYLEKWAVILNVNERLNRLLPPPA